MPRGKQPTRQVLLDRIGELERLTEALAERVAKQSQNLTKLAMKGSGHEVNGIDQGTKPGSDPGLSERNHAQAGDGTREEVPGGVVTTTTCGGDSLGSDRAAEAEAGQAARFDGCTPLTSTVAGWRSKTVNSVE